jgi:hypothetical protein
MSSPASTLGLWVRIPLEAWKFVCVYSVFVLSCVGSALAMGWSLVQGVLPTAYKCKITEPHKEEAKARYGLQRHIRRRSHELAHWFLPCLLVNNGLFLSLPPFFYCRVEVFNRHGRFSGRYQDYDLLERDSVWLGKWEPFSFWLQFSKHNF